MMSLALAAVVTFRDIQPILERRCLSCHRAGEIGRMPLVTYSQARPWAKAIREAVLSRRMPPWFAASGSFANDPRLTAAEIGAISDWVASGAPEGERRGVVPSPAAGREWDLTLTMPKPVLVPAREELEYQLVDLPASFAEDRWVTAAEVRPGARGVVHHAVVYVREAGQPLPRHGPTKADILAVYAPGQPPMTLPEGMAKKIPAGAALAMQIHYTPNGKAVEDRTSLRLAFAPKPPARRVLTLQIASTDFRIPPGEPNHRESASGTLPNDALLLSMFPHLHLRGKAFEYTLVEPGGRVETLLRVAPYDFYWQLNYVLARPRTLLKGSRLRVTAWWDNSPNNPRNPDPLAEVSYGEPSKDEMMVGFFDVAVEGDVSKEEFFRR